MSARIVRRATVARWLCVPRRDDAPAYARNWWTVLVADGLLGVVVAGAGLWAMASASVFVGAALVAAAVFYLGLVGRRALRWRRLRRHAGLDGEAEGAGPARPESPTGLDGPT